jgi:hypothetical protein
MREIIIHRTTKHVQGGLILALINSGNTFSNSCIVLVPGKKKRGAVRNGTIIYALRQPCLAVTQIVAQFTRQMYNDGYLTLFVV